MHVTVPGRRHGDDNLAIHRASLKPHELRERHGLPVTSPTRTILDLAATDLSDQDLERATAEAIALRLLTPSLLARAVQANPRRRGIRRLRALLDLGPKRTRSKPERTLLALIRAAALPEPLTNQRIGPWEVDLYWPDAGLVVEVDAYSTTPRRGRSSVTGERAPTSPTAGSQCTG